MDHNLIVFDWNGTILADTAHSWRAANLCLEHLGAAPVSFARYRETLHFPVIHFYTLNGVSVDTLLKHQSENNVLFQDSYERMAARARTRRGARPLLRWIQNQGMSCIILSNYRTERIEATAARLGLSSYFQAVLGHNDNGETILHKTTKAERLSEFMLARNYKPENTVIIGDSMEEPEIARRLGLTSIGITGGTISTKRLREAAPDYIIHSLAEVRGIVCALYES